MKHETAIIKFLRLLLAGRTGDPISYDDHLNATCNQYKTVNRLSQAAKQLAFG